MHILRSEIRVESDNSEVNLFMRVIPYESHYPCETNKMIICDNDKTFFFPIRDFLSKKVELFCG